MNKRSLSVSSYSAGGATSRPFSPKRGNSSSSSAATAATNTGKLYGASSNSRGVLLSVTVLLALMFYSTKIYLDVVASVDTYPFSSSSFPGNESKIVMLTIYSSVGSDRAFIKDVGNSKARILQKICLENKRMYAELMGLRLIVGTPSNDVEAQNPRLLKVKWVLDLFSQGFERVFYMDLDTLILDAAFDIRPAILGMSSPLAVSMDFNKYAISKRQKRERGHAKDVTDIERYNTGIMLLQNHPLVIHLFDKIFEEGMRKRDDVSDQRIFNAYMKDFFPTKKHITVLNRIKWNAFPRIDDSRYKFMGHVLGDEKDNVTYITHFAGTFGGATQEKGFTEPVAMLIVYKELLLRHLKFLSTLSYDATQRLGLSWEKGHLNTPRMLSIVKKYQSTKLMLEECISRVFTDFDATRADKAASSCLQEALS